MDGLSQKQKDIFSYIKRFMQDKGYPPAIRDIQHDLKISSTSVVAYNLNKLVSLKMLERDPKNARGIKLAQAYMEEAPKPSANTRHVPFVGFISAGSPIPSPDQADPSSVEEVPADLVPERIGDVYALRVRGNSMVDALISDGDLILMRYTPQIENGQMAAVRVIDRDEVTLKKIYFEGDKIRLQPANPTMEPWTENAGNVEVQGRVVGVVRSML